MINGQNKNIKLKYLICAALYLKFLHKIFVSWAVGHIKYLQTSFADGNILSLVARVPSMLFYQFFYSGSDLAQLQKAHEQKLAYLTTMQQQQVNIRYSRLILLWINMVFLNLAYKFTGRFRNPWGP